MTLTERALTRQGVWPLPAGVLIETRALGGTGHSLMLRAYDEFNGVTYTIRHGVYAHGERILKHFVERGTGPWPRIRSRGPWRVLCVRNAAQ